MAAIVSREIQLKCRPVGLPGQIRWEETVVDGLENAPKAFIGLFTGDNTGKMLVRLHDKA